LKASISEIAPVCDIFAKYGQNNNNNNLIYDNAQCPGNLESEATVDRRVINWFATRDGPKLSATTKAICAENRELKQSGQIGKLVMESDMQQRCIWNTGRHWPSTV